MINLIETNDNYTIINLYNNGRFCNIFKEYSECVKWNDDENVQYSIVRNKTGLYLLVMKEFHPEGNPIIGDTKYYGNV